ncbi:MAG: hypothetical protein PHP46_00940 [Candidatus Omnitrophica bacterium]|nr:hypothetical protein [Candidatus Omnitrophota bacterium]
MGRTIGSTLAVVAFLVFSASFSYCLVVEPEIFVDEYNAATDLQRAQMDDQYRYVEMNVSGTIKNVEDWDTFDERTDTSRHYYRVTLDTTASPKGVPYEILIFSNDKDKVSMLNRGEKMHFTGTFLKIIDQRLLYSIWVYNGELTEEDKVMFR